MVIDEHDRGRRFLPSILHSYHLGSNYSELTLVVRGKYLYSDSS